MNKTSLPLRLLSATILIVDDVEFNCRLISNVFKQAGYKNLIQANNGEEALSKTHEFRPDLVILDLEMPVMDGFSYIEQVRADDSFASMPILVQTIDTQRETKLKALSCGADDFVNKPLDQDELLLRSNIHLNRHFTTYDIEQMRLCLELELNEATSLINELSKTAPAALLRKLSRHYDALGWR